MIAKSHLLIALFVWILPNVQVLTETSRITTVISDLRPLLETQNYTINILGEIIRKKNNTLCFLEKELKRYMKEHKKALKAVRYYLGNPINSLTLIKRLTVDLEFIEEVINRRVGFKTNKSKKYPSMEDYDDAVRGIFRLQTVYHLNVTQIADGILNSTFSEGGKLYSEIFLPMTALDCYDLGKALSARDLTKRAMPWLLEAHRLLLSGRLSGISETDVVWAICKGYNDLDENEKYIEWTEKLINLKPKMNILDLEIYIDIHRMRLGKKKYAEELQRQEYKNNVKKRKKHNFKVKPLIIPKDEVKTCRYGPLSKGFKLLCKGEVNVGSYIAKRLKCWYTSGHHPFTQLARVKTEQVYVKPDIYIYYEVLHDKEIEEIKEYVEPKLQQGLIGVGAKIKKSAVVHRQSKTGIIQDALKATHKISERISDLTGYNVNSSEYYHVNNYGVWGMYSQHYDFWQDPKLIGELGNRLATLVIYMSTVEQGGATVFPVLGLTVYPVKGAALMWTNLHPSGEVDYVTCHGSCPVLRGNKWAMTKWVNTRNQELHKPCTLKFQTRRPHDIPYPELKKYP